MNILHGIPNCDTIRKARKWLNQQEIEFTFHDFRKDGVSREKLQQWAAEGGWEQLLNRRGTTWRKLPPEEREGLDQESVITLLLEHPAMIKRPVLESDRLQGIEVGFSEARYQEIFC